MEPEGWWLWVTVAWVYTYGAVKGPFDGLLEIESEDEFRVVRRCWWFEVGWVW